MAMVSVSCEKGSHYLCLHNRCQCSCHGRNINKMNKPSWYTVHIQQGITHEYGFDTQYRSLNDATLRAEVLKKDNPGKRVIILGVIAEVVEVPQPKYELKLWP